MSKRYIRLKELTPNMNENYVPSNDYLKATSGLQHNEIYPVKTDSSGNQVSILERESKNSIYILGASTIESIYIRSSMKPHTYLEHLLLENGYDYSVFNIGASGAHTLSIINVIINKLGNKKGSTLVITLPSNDLSILSFDKNYFSTHWRFSSIIPALDKTVTRSASVDYKPYIKNLEIIVSICNILELELFFTTIIYTGTDKNLIKLNSILINFCKLNNVSLIDFEDMFTSYPNLFYDKLHFLPQGAKKYSIKIFDSIKYKLVKSQSNIITTHDIVSDLTLDKNIKWANYFEVSGYDFMTIVVDTEFGSDADTKQAIITVDYSDADVVTSLAKSAQSDIGYFSYLTGPKNKRTEVLLHIGIPLNCSRMRIGLRSWASKNVKVHKSFLSLVKV